MLYAIVDVSPAGPPDPVALAQAALMGGATHIQLRAKGIPDSRFFSLAADLGKLCAGRAAFWVNDRADLAALCPTAEGVHLGQGDLPLPLARRVLRPGQKVGLSTHTAAEVQAAVEAGADLIGFGPVFESQTKSGHAAVTGVEGLRRAVALAGGKPVVAIGGISSKNAYLCASVGAYGVAVIGALAQAPDAKAAARQLVDAFEAGKESRP